MKKAVMGAACAAVLAAAPAAADGIFAVPPAPLSRDAPHSWAGFYGGLNAGGASGGGTVGGQAGYNWQFGRAVIGVESDVRQGGVADPGQAGLQGSVRSRIGLGSDQLLLYGTGGAVFQRR